MNKYLFALSLLLFGALFSMHKQNRKRASWQKSRELNALDGLFGFRSEDDEVIDAMARSEYPPAAVTLLGRQLSGEKNMTRSHLAALKALEQSEAQQPSQEVKS